MAGQGRWRRGRVSLAVLAFVVGHAAAVRSALACNTASCPLVTQAQEGLRAGGAFGLDLSFRHMDQDRYQRAPGVPAGAVAPHLDLERGLMFPGHHRDDGMRHRLLQVELSYGITSRLTLSAAVPLFNEREHQHREIAAPVDVGDLGEHGHGAPVSTEPVLSRTPTFETASGLGDVAVTAGYLVFRGMGRSFSLHATVELPTGADDRAAPERGVLRPDVQPGSGSWDGQLSARYQQWVGSANGFLGASYRRNGTNAFGYRFGTDLTLSTGAGFQPRKALAISTQLTGRWLERDTLRAQAVPTTGSFALTLVPGARVRLPGGRSWIYAYVKLPLYNRVNEAQLVTRFDVIAGVTRSF